MLVTIKLLIQPTVTGALVFELSTIWAGTALLLNALPVGNGPFMRAELFGREASTMARTTLISFMFVGKAVCDSGVNFSSIKFLLRGGQ